MSLLACTAPTWLRLWASPLLLGGRSVGRTLGTARWFGQHRLVDATPLIEGVVLVLSDLGHEFKVDNGVIGRYIALLFSCRSPHSLGSCIVFSFLLGMFMVFPKQFLSS